MKCVIDEKFAPSAAVMPFVMLFSSFYARQQGFSELPHTFILHRSTYTRPGKMSAQNDTLGVFAHTNM